MTGIHIRSQSLSRPSIVGIALLFPWATTIAQPVATVTTKDQTVTTTAPVVPAQTITITTQKNGGKVSFTIPAQTLKPLTAMVLGQTAPIVFVPMSVACDFHHGITTLNLDGTLTITGAVCTLTVKK
jgi:hypothetical protein